MVDYIMVMERSGGIMKLDIGEMIKESIAQQNLSQKQVAEYLKISPQTLNSYLNGRSVFRLDDFYKLVHLLHLNPNALLGINDRSYAIQNNNLHNILLCLDKEQRETIIHMATFFWQKKK